MQQGLPELDISDLSELCTSAGCLPSPSCSCLLVSDESCSAGTLNLLNHDVAHDALKVHNTKAPLNAGPHLYLVGSASAFEEETCAGEVS